MPDLKSLADIQPHELNPRQITPEALAGLRVSQTQYGDLSGLTWNRRNGRLVAGHQRYANLKAAHGDALKLVDHLDMPGEGEYAALIEPDGKLWPIRVVDWDEETHLGAMVVANAEPIQGDWDAEKAMQLLPQIEASLGDLYDAMGLDELAAELEPLVPEKETEGLTDPDAVPEPPAEPVTRPGDLWTLGKHRLLCADSTKADDVARVMGGEKAALCFTSPPYLQQRDYTGASDCSDWDGLMQGVFGNLDAAMADDGQVLVNLGLVHRDNEWHPYWDGWIEWMRGQGWRRFAWYVWDKGFGMCGDWSGRCAPSHEWIFHFNRVSVKPAHCIPKEERSIGNRGKHTFRHKDGTLHDATSPDATDNTHKIPDSVWRSPPAHTAGQITAAHPAVYPVALPEMAMTAWPGVAYDPFLGSGTTLIAAEQLGRRCYGIEIAPVYVDVAVRRWQSYCGRQATLDGDGRTFDEVAAERCPEAKPAPTAKAEAGS